MTLTKKDKKKRLRTNYFRLLNDDLFWQKFVNSEPSQSYLTRLRNSKKRGHLPRRDALLRFVEKYKYISKDTRDDRDIILWLLSEKED